MLNLSMQKGTLFVRFLMLPILLLSSIVAMAQQEPGDATRKSLVPVIEHEFRASVFEGLQKLDPCPKDGPYTPQSCTTAVGLGALWLATNITHVIAIGRCSGASLHEARNTLLVGDYTSAPEGSDGFVNIANKLCFWRDTGRRVDCPPPEPECYHAATAP